MTNHTLSKDEETKGGQRTAHTDGRGQKHALARDEETKGGLRTANTDGGGQKHTQTRDEETKGGLRTANQMGEDKSTHSLEMRDKGGSENSKHRWGRTNAHTI